MATKAEGKGKTGLEKQENAHKVNPKSWLFCNGVCCCKHSGKANWCLNWLCYKTIWLVSFEILKDKDSEG
jgi:hypothetical protein